MRYQVLLRLLAVIFAFGGFAQIAQAEDFRDPRTHAQIRGWLSQRVAAPSDVVKLVVRIEPLDDYHVYALATRDPEDVEKPTLVVLDKTSGLEMKPATADTKPSEKASKDNKAGKALFHKQPVHFTIELRVPQDAKPGDYAISGIVGYQTCQGDNFCDQPRAARFKGKLEVGKTEAIEPAPLEFSEAKYGEAAKLAEQLSAASAPAAEPGVIGFDESALAKNVQVDHSLWSLAPLAFFGGVILNLMPCVFPVIGLKVLSFVEQSHHSRARLLALNAWYTLGVLGVFIGLALTAIVLRQFVGVDDFKFGSQNSVPGFVIGMAAVMFVMALSLLGVWEIPIPGFLGTGKASELSTREGAIGAVSKGAVTTLLGASCSGPLVAVPLGFALDRGTPAWATLGIFTLIGLGMAAPYMVIALNPRLLKMLPRPGAWMDTFKNIMGFVLLAAMVWVLTWLKLPLVAPTVAFLVGLWFACWWVGKMEITAPPGRRLRGWIVAVAVSVAAGFFAFSWLAPRILEKYDELLNREVAQRVSGGTPRNGPREKSDDPNRLPWSAFSRDVLEQLTRQRKTVMVDFTADWCPNCIALEEYVLNTAAIKRVVDQNGVVPLVADYTDTPPEITKMLSLLKAGAVPVLAIFPADRPNDPIVFRGGYTQSDLIEALEHAGPSIPAAPTSTTAMR